MTAPATPRIAVLASHGQPSAPAAPEADLADLAAQVAGLLPEWEIRSATLSTPGRLEQQAEDGAVIYPFFMARGWFSSQVLPRRLTGLTYQSACPFGLDPDLPQLVANAIHAEIHRQSDQLAETSLLLAAHGSARGPKAAEAAQRFAAELAKVIPLRRIRCGYVEQSPWISTAADDIPNPSICLPFFAQNGDHVQQDIPDALTQARFAGQVMPVVGALPGVAQLIAAALRRAVTPPKIN